MLTLNKCLIIEINSITKLNICIVSHFELSDLRCEMTVMTIGRAWGMTNRFADLSSQTNFVPKNN